MADNETTIKSTLKYILEIIDKPIYNNAGVVCQVIAGLMQKYDLTLPRAEQILRDLKSRVYLLGLPLRIYESDKTKLTLRKDLKPEEIPHITGKYTAILPGRDERFEYALWVCMNGKEEVPKTLKSYELTFNDIDLTLEQTGLLTIKEGNN